MKYFRSIYHCVMMILMFIQCSGILSANIYEPTETSANKFNILSSNTNEHIKKESNLDFDLNKKILFRGSLQLIIKEIEPKKLGKYEAWDIKKIHKDKSLGSGYLTLGKTAILFKNKTPDFFSKDTIFSKEYIQNTNLGATILSINKDENEISFNTRLKILFIKLASVKTTLHVEEYDSLDEFTKTLDEEYLVSWEKKSLAIEYPLEKILVTYSTKDDISPSMLSVGGSTVNFYYNVNDEHTLHVSYKVISFCKVPDIARKTVVDQQYSRTWASLHSIQKFKSSIL